MKRLTYIIITTTLLLFVVTEFSFAQTWTKKNARRWVESGEWCGELKKAKPYKGTDMVEFASQYYKQKARWDKVFAWMACHDVATLEPGKYEIDGEATVETPYTFDIMLWKSRKIQYVDSTPQTFFLFSPLTIIGPV